MGKNKDDKKANVPSVQTAGGTTSPPAKVAATPPSPTTVAEPPKSAAESPKAAAELPKAAAESPKAAAEPPKAAGTVTREGSKAGTLTATIKKISQTTGLVVPPSKKSSQTSSLLTPPKKTSQTSGLAASLTAPPKASASPAITPEPSKIDPVAKPSAPTQTTTAAGKPPVVTANAAVQNKMPSTTDDTKGSTRAGHPAKGAPPQRQRKPKEGPCEWLCEQVPVNVPSPEIAQKVLHPNKDVFVFKVAKVGPTGDRRCKMELELVTPKGPYKKVPVRIDTRETQCDPDPPPCVCCKPKKERKR